MIRTSVVVMVKSGLPGLLLFLVRWCALKILSLAGIILHIHNYKGTTNYTLKVSFEEPDKTKWLSDDITNSCTLKSHCSSLELDMVNSWRLPTVSGCSIRSHQLQCFMVWACFRMHGLTPQLLLHYTATRSYDLKLLPSKSWRNVHPIEYRSNTARFVGFGDRSLPHFFRPFAHPPSHHTHLSSWWLAQTLILRSNYTCNNYTCRTWPWRSKRTVGIIILCRGHKTQNTTSQNLQAELNERMNMNSFDISCSLH